jgi:LCP family protein required for cell wall assembly
MLRRLRLSHGSRAGVPVAPGIDAVTAESVEAPTGEPSTLPAIRWQSADGDPDGAESGASAADARAAAWWRSSPAIAAGLSFVFPGLGQLYLRRWISAAAFALPAAAMLTWFALQFTQGGFYFALALLDQSYAQTIMAWAAIFTLWRIAAITHPFVVTKPRRFSLPSGLALAALLILTPSMGYAVFANAANAYAFTDQVQHNDFAVADVTDPPTPAATPTPTWTPSDLFASPTPTSSASWIPFATATPEPSDPCAGLYAPPVQPTATPTVRTPIRYNDLLPAEVTPTPTVEPTPTPTETPIVGPTATPTAEPTPTPIPTPIPTPTATPSPTPTATPTSTPSPTPTATPSPTPTATPTATPSPSPTPVSHRMTILLTGVDFMAGRSHALNDTLMLVSIDLDTRAVAMISVPRDTAGFPLYWGGQAPADFKINRLVGNARQLGSPDPPMLTLAKEIGYLVGVKTDYYAEIDIDGFGKMIDLVGGVDINNPRTLDDPFFCTYIPAGKVHLDSVHALQYVRSRESTNDYNRAARQQLVMVALEKKIAQPAMLPKLGSLIAQAGKSIATNFPLNTAKDYFDIAQNLSGISHCVLGPPYNYHPDSKLTGGTWTSALLLDKVASLSKYLFGTDSRYYPETQIVPAPCQNHS